MTDEPLLISMSQGGQIIGEYIEPGPRDAEQTPSRLTAVLDSPDLAAAIERLEKDRWLRVVN